MKEIMIDCRDIHTRSDLHRIFADTLLFPVYYGANLDALHDCLTGLSTETSLRLINWANAEAALGNYARAARQAITDAASENANLSIEFE